MTAARFPLLRRLCLLAVAAGLAGLAAATILAELGDRWWFADFFAHFRFQYIVVALLLAGAALLLRRRALAAVAGLLIVPQALVVGGVPVAENATAAPPEARIRIASANIQWSNASIDALLAHFHDAQPDVIALEEVTPAAAPLIRRLAATHPHVAPADWWETGSGVVLLSRYPQEDVKALLSPEAPIVLATIRHPAGRFRAIAVHAPYPMGPTLYAYHAFYFAGWMREVQRTDLPVIVTGDFNLTPWTPRFRQAWRTTGLSFAGAYRLWPRTWPAHAKPRHYLLAMLIGGLPIDHVLVSRRFAVVSAQRGPYVGSDHYPVTVDLALKP